MPKTSRLDRELRDALEAAVLSGGEREEEVNCRLTELASQMISFQSDASGELATAIYTAIRHAWKANREQRGTGALGRRWEAETIEYHTALVEAIRRAQKGRVI